MREVKALLGEDASVGEIWILNVWYFGQRRRVVRCTLR